MRYSLIALLIFGFALPPVYAADVYVSDYLVITLRAGKGDSFKVVKSLSSGMVLEVIEVDGEFTHVRTKEGLDGWVRNQYLSEKPVARSLVDDYSKKLEQLAAENKKLKDSLAEVNREAKQLSQDQKRIVAEKTKMEQEHAQIKELAARPMELEDKNKNLSSENTAMKTELAKLRLESSEFKKNQVQKWFLAGGGVFLFGIVAGLILPRFKSRRQSNWV
ncbi:MAG: TIGR04211 family SH3 domain-containing protein [Gammaproteobacteria bacterium]|nr:TIGR04211 family SH3 domain-containing protein [Gammaproteobacteria bacterium]